MRWIVRIVIASFLGGCSLSPLMNADVIDYFKVNDLAANRIILLNVLRAKDGAPLHFSELSLVRGQISANATAGITFPFGPTMHATVQPRNLATVTSSVSSSPSFDVGSLDTQDFTKGVMAPIAPATVSFFLNEGIDDHLVLLLLVSGVRTPGNQEIIRNEPESVRSVCYSESLGGKPHNYLPLHYTIIGPADTCNTAGGQESEFLGFLRVIDHLRRVYATNYMSPPEPVGAPFIPDMRADLRSLTAMDPAKYRLRKLPSGQYQLFAAVPHETVVLCQEPAPGGTPTVLASLRGGQQEGRVPAEACGAPVQPGATTGPGTHSDVNAFDMLTIRSTLEVIQYIGRILTFQTEDSARLARPRCVTLYFEGTNPGCDGNILFNLNHNPLDTPIGLEYGGEYWAVPPSRSCTGTKSCDHTLETMAMVALLLNQNKSAKDIPSTPAFEAVP